jgi:oxygen-independent coproporphyrinogen-3 oxidase
MGAVEGKLKIKPDRGMGLYVHIPFCVARCYYCDFVSTAGLGRAWQVRYREAILKEWALYRERWVELKAGQESRDEWNMHRESGAEWALHRGSQTERKVYPNSQKDWKMHEKGQNELKVRQASQADVFPDVGAGWKSVYFGGGTPTYLDEDILEELMRKLVGATLCQEFTVEANPGTLTESKLGMLRRTGCSRLSIGAQSVDNKRLAWLGRRHTAEGFRQAWDMARASGFANMNLDLMYGLPGQSLEHWRDTLAEALTYQPEHISLYQLNIEEGTPLARCSASGEECVADEDICCKQYEQAHEILEEAGYRHYEISNYAKPGFESHHNTLYWRNGCYLGLGAGAASHLPGLRYTNNADLEAYCSDMEKGVSPIAEREEISVSLALKDEMMLAFRLKEGIRKKPFQERWGFALDQKYGSALEKHRVAGLLEEDEEHVFPTLQGWLQYNSWVQDFL